MSQISGHTFCTVAESTGSSKDTIFSAAVSNGTLLGCLLSSASIFFKE